jgi:hypothetical protein
MNSNINTSAESKRIVGHEGLEETRRGRDAKKFWNH